MPASLCNSSGLFLEEAPFLDLVRPGYALYGGNPTPGNDNPMRRVVALEAMILQVRDIQGGETAGYNARWTAPGRRKLATIGLGYADGFLRSGTGGPISVEVFADGRFCPVVGRISMDLVDHRHQRRRAAAPRRPRRDPGSRISAWTNWRRNPAPSAMKSSPIWAGASKGSMLATAS